MIMKQYPFISRLVLSVFCLATLVGCSFGQQGQSVNQLDLGSLPVTTPAAANKAVTVKPVVVPPGLSTGLVQTTQVIWRQTDQGTPQRYATYEWTAPPAALVRQRLIDRLSRQGPVLPTVLGAQTSVLRMNLQQFEQVFEPDGQSVGVLTLQVVLTQGDTILGSELIQERVVTQSADAPAGAHALSQATNQAAEHIAQWVQATLK